MANTFKIYNFTIHNFLFFFFNSKEFYSIIITTDNYG